MVIEFFNLNCIIEEIYDIVSCSCMCTWFFAIPMLVKHLANTISIVWLFICKINSKLVIATLHSITSTCPISLHYSTAATQTLFVLLIHLITVFTCVINTFPLHILTLSLHNLYISCTALFFVQKLPNCFESFEYPQCCFSVSNLTIKNMGNFL